MSMQGFTHNLVPMRGQVKVVIHILVGNGAIGVDETWVHIKERGMRER